MERAEDVWRAKRAAIEGDGVKFKKCDVGDDGWPISDAYMFVIRPGNEWLSFDDYDDLVEFVVEHATPSQPKDIDILLPGDGTILYRGNDATQKASVTNG